MTMASKNHTVKGGVTILYRLTQRANRRYYRGRYNPKNIRVLWGWLRHGY
jgi:hypothetical protein